MLLSCSRMLAQDIAFFCSSKIPEESIEVVVKYPDFFTLQKPVFSSKVQAEQ